MSKRVQLNGLSPEGWAQLKHLAAVSNMKRSRYLKEVITQIVFQRWATEPVEAVVPSQLGKRGKMTTNLVIRMPEHIITWMDAYIALRAYPSRIQLVRAAAGWALKHGVYFRDHRLEFTHSCEECHTWPPKTTSSYETLSTSDKSGTINTSAQAA